MPPLVSLCCISPTISKWLNATQFPLLKPHHILKKYQSYHIISYHQEISILKLIVGEISNLQLIISLININLKFHFWRNINLQHRISLYRDTPRETFIKEVANLWSRFPYWKSLYATYQQVCVHCPHGPQLHIQGKGLVPPLIKWWETATTACLSRLNCGGFLHTTCRVQSISQQQVHTPVVPSDQLANYQVNMTLCEVLWWKISRCITKILTPRRVNQIFFQRYHVKAEIRSFPTMYNTI